MIDLSHYLYPGNDNGLLKQAYTWSTTTIGEVCRRKCKNCTCADCTSCPCKSCKIERLEKRVKELEQVTETVKRTPRSDASLNRGRSDG